MLCKTHRKAQNHEARHSHPPTLAEEQKQKLIQLILNNATGLELMKRKNRLIKLKITLEMSSLPAALIDFFKGIIIKSYTRSFIFYKICLQVPRIYIDQYIQLVKQYIVGLSSRLVYSIKKNRLLRLEGAKAISKDRPSINGRRPDSNF
jgi:hypothetical protein